MTTLNDLLAMNRHQLHQVMVDGQPLDHERLAGTVWMGVDLSLPGWMGKILWKTFRKTFHRDPDTGVLRGWNVRLQQTGWTDPGVPMLDRKGDALTFGHYHVLPAAGRRFGKGWSGGDYLDYGVAGNTLLDVARFTYAPLVTVPGGNGDLLLGWEVFKLGPLRLPLPLYWALQYEGTLDAALPPPRG